MYFWKIEELKDDIKGNKLTEKDTFLYAFIYIVIYELMYEIALYFPTENSNLWDVVLSFADVIIIILGTIYVFKVNGGINGSNFLNRFFSLGFVLSVRFTVFMIPVFIVWDFFDSIIYPEIYETQTTPLDTIMLILFNIAFYWRLSIHISDVKNS